MNTLFKTVVLSSAIFAGSLIAGAQFSHASAANLGVKVQINDKLVSFLDAQPFIDSVDSTQVPIRFVAENLGAKVEYEMINQQVSVTIVFKDKTIKIQTSSKEATVNGEKVILNANPLFSQSRTYVPLRFISETIGYRIQWDSNNHIAIIDEDGKYHSPAWYAPAEIIKTMAVNTISPSDIISTAKKYIGVKYQWGGTTPRGFDCSGFIDYVFNQNGIDLPHSSQEMHLSVGTHISKSDLQAGDLIFFITNKVSISHVGIYIGNNQFISATNKGVKIDNLYSSYWSPKYNGAKRIL